MAKHHEMSDTQYAQFRRSHPCPSPLDSEEAKVRCEFACRAAKSHRQKLRSRQLLDRLPEATSPEAWDALDALEEDDAERRKLLGSVRAHRAQLKSLVPREAAQG